MADSFPPPGYYLRVRDWDKHFERAQTRKIDSPLSWIALPTAHDGCKFRKLIRTKRGVTIFGAFCLLLEVGAKMDKRGDFVRPDRSILTCEDFEAITGADRRTFHSAIELLTSKEFGWLELVAISQNGGSSPPPRSDMREEERREEERRREERGSRAPDSKTGQGVDSASNPSERVRSIELIRQILDRVPGQQMRKRIEEEVTDLECWQRVLEIWKEKGHNPGSFDFMLDRYKKELRDQDPYHDLVEKYEREAREEKGAEGGD